jgi:hypothetical protein
VLPPEDRSLYRLLDRLRKLIPMAAAKDSRPLHEHKATVSQALPVCKPLSEHRSSCDWPNVPGRPTSVVGRGRSQRKEVGAIRLSFLCREALATDFWCSTSTCFWWCLSPNGQSRSWSVRSNLPSGHAMAGGAATGVQGDAGGQGASGGQARGAEVAGDRLPWGKR